MDDRKIIPVHAIRSVRVIGEIGLRRRPSFAQLQQWLKFVQQKHADTPTHSPDGRSPKPTEPNRS